LTLNFTVRDAEAESRKLKPARKAFTRSMKDPITENLEDRLREKLNTKVKISRQGDGGQISIDFYSNEDLNSIVSQITK